MVNNVPWLSVLWLVPLAGAVLIILLPPGRRRLAKWAGMVVSVLTLAVSIVVAAEFKPSAEPYQFVESIPGYRRSAPAIPLVWTASQWCWCC